MVFITLPGNEKLLAVNDDLSPEKIICDYWLNQLNQYGSEALLSVIDSFDLFFIPLVTNINIPISLRKNISLDERTHLNKRIVPSAHCFHKYSENRTSRTKRSI